MMETAEIVNRKANTNKQQETMAGALAQYPGISQSADIFVDNRADTVLQIVLQRMIDSGSRMNTQEALLMETANNSNLAGRNSVILQPKQIENTGSFQLKNDKELISYQSATPPVLQRIKWGTIRQKRWTYFSDSGMDAYGTHWTYRLVDTDADNPITVMKPDDNTTFFCHGFTFGGYRVEGGPYSMDGAYVTRVLSDEYTEVDVPQAGKGVAFLDKEGVGHPGIVHGIDIGQSDPRDAVSIISKLGSKSLSVLPLKELLKKYPGTVKYYGKTGGGGEAWLEELMPHPLRGEDIERRHQGIKEIERGLSEVDFLFRLFAKLLAGIKPSSEEMELYYSIRGSRL